MTLTNAKKYELSVSLVSNHLKYLGHEHEINQSSSTHDIKVKGCDKKIKIFCNFSRSPSIKIPNNFNSKEGILYMVVSPSHKNNVGYISSGGQKSVIDKSIKTFKTKGSPKNIVLSKLGFTGLKKFLH